MNNERSKDITNKAKQIQSQCNMILQCKCETCIKQTQSDTIDMQSYEDMICNNTILRYA
jgi:hypothetical protein